MKERNDKKEKINRQRDRGEKDKDERKGRRHDTGNKNKRKHHSGLI
jgi:hypothetical protein